MTLQIPKSSTRLYLDFFARASEEVAKDLLGRVMVNERKGKSPLYVQLTEIAAYEGIVGDDIEKAKKRHKNLFYSNGVLGVSSAYGKCLIDIGTQGLCEPSCVTLIAGILFNKRGISENLQGPGNLSEALEIDRSYDGVPLNFGAIWIGGFSVDQSQIQKRNKSNVPENCKGFFYFR